jgi:hypothetical protein
MSDRKKTLSWEEVRGRIDAGATGEKVAGSDPAAAPLGTDDESAGIPTHPAAEDAERKSSSSG